MGESIQKITHERSFLTLQGVDSPLNKNQKIVNLTQDENGYFNVAENIPDSES